MVASKSVESTRSLPAPLPRAWHINMAHGGGETITAHDCTVESGGVLLFHNILPTGRILVRALCAREWNQAELIDTPVSAPVQLRPFDLSEVRP